MRRPCIVGCPCNAYCLVPILNQGALFFFSVLKCERVCVSTFVRCLHHPVRFIIDNGRPIAKYLRDRDKRLLHSSQGSTDIAPRLLLLVNNYFVRPRYLAT